MNVYNSNMIYHTYKYTSTASYKIMEKIAYLAMETFCLSPPESLAPLSPTEVCSPLGSFLIVSIRLHFSIA